jgi:hypothetical protein
LLCDTVMRLEREKRTRVGWEGRAWLVSP